MESPYAIEMLHITKRFPGIIANDDITLQLKKGEIHALLGENGAGKSTLMSVLFGLYQAEEGVIKKDGVEVSIKDPNDANALGIGMVHQHFKLVECFTVLDNIIMGVEPTKHGLLQKKEAREKVLALSEKYGLQIDPDALIEEITVYTIKKEFYDLGLSQAETPFGNTVAVYDPERTICDVIRSRNRMEMQTIRDALRQYTARKHKDLRRLMRYAQALHIETVLRNYLEVLL